jgi:UDP-N-acetylglucosamine 2-epimerase
VNVATVVGARPQFVKASPVSKILRKRHRETLIHTGQHYDARMSQLFFDELDIPPPDFNLGVGSSSHGKQTGDMLAGIEAILTALHFDVVLVYGDTNSTLAGALAAAKLHLPVAHVEAGLRSFNRHMPEEINRVLADHVSDLLFCPTEFAVHNLAAEGITWGVHQVGDVMLDALRQRVEHGLPCLSMLEPNGLEPGGYVLATVHRAENTDDAETLGSVLAALGSLEEPVLLPLHPRTRAAIERFGLTATSKLVRVVEPLGFSAMLAAEQNARVIVTDSGGVQKEAYWLGVPCVTIRQETEWVETLSNGWNVLAGTEREAIVSAVRTARAPGRTAPLSDRAASEQICAILESRFDS